jgi:hypothetical protein
MTGEHWISEAILHLLVQEDGKLRVTGYPWQKGAVQSLTPSTCKIRALCKRHNNALSPLDTTGARFLNGIRNTPAFLQQHEIRVLILNGDNIERWILKTLCTHQVLQDDTWQPPIEWLNILWEMKQFHPNCGLYFNHDVGQTSVDEGWLRFRTLTHKGYTGPVGAIIELGALKFALTMIPPNPVQTPGSLLIPKYYRPSDLIVTYGKSEVLYSFGWEADTRPCRIKIGWDVKP